MKRFILAIGAILLSAVMFYSLAQKTHNLRPNYINLNYVHQTLKMSGLHNESSDLGVALTVGHTFYILKNKPIANMIRFGIDATWFDINYADYKFEYTDPELDEMVSEKVHQLEVGMQVGPSITISPNKNLNISAYFRYAPTFSALFFKNADRAARNYASFFVTGASVSYKFIGLGIEKRWGKANYIGNKTGEEEQEFYPFRSNIKTDGLRVYLSLRF